MIAVAQDQAEPVARKPRRPVAKSTRGQGAERKKIGVYISTESYRRLGAEALMTGEDLSIIIDRLIRENCRRFVISDRAKSADQVTANESAN